MASYERETYVDAPLDRVWEFHSRAEGLEALTPEWMGLEIVRVRGPDGAPDPDVLVAGSEVDVRVRPFGVGPAQRWTSRIVHRERDDGVAVFRDRMVDGPFAHWVHTHGFAAEDGGTRVRDAVSYDLAGGGLGRAVSPIAAAGLEPMFRFRHRRTRELLE